MDLATILAAAGGLLVGVLVALGLGATWWGARLKTATHRIATLEESRQSAKDESGHLRRQVEQLQHEVNELRMQAMRNRPRAEAATEARGEAEDLLLRAAPPAADPFPATMIQPRKPPTEAADPFPATMIQGRRPQPDAETTFPATDIQPRKP